jgi:predicted ester cyclase
VDCEWGKEFLGGSVQKAIEAVQRTFRAIESGNVSDAGEYIAKDYLNRESVDDGRSEKRGPDEFRETAAWLRSSFSDLRFENVDVIACGDRVVVVTYMSGRHTAPFLGLPATNRSFRQRQVHLFQMDSENKVREHLAQRDDLGLRRQLTAG